MEEFAFEVTDIVRLDADQAEFTLHLIAPTGERVSIRECRVVALRTSRPIVSGPVRFRSKERIRIVRLPNRLRRLVGAEVAERIYNAEQGWLRRVG
jgi:hypothetical protein